MHEGPNFLALAILFTLPCFPMALMLNKSQRERSPELLPFTWGYFFGLSGAFGFAVFAVLQLLAGMTGQGDRAEFSLFLGVALSTAALAFSLVIKRYKWAFVIATIVSLNPILWIVNGIYIRNRWRELRGMPSIPIGSMFRRLSMVDRILIAGTVFWAFAVLTFVVLFEPYGSYIDSRDRLHIVKVVFFPTVVAWVGRLIFGFIIERRR